MLLLLLLLHASGIVRSGPVMLPELPVRLVKHRQ
jgi:hypothetical protein